MLHKKLSISCNSGTDKQNLALVTCDKEARFRVCMWLIHLPVKQCYMLSKDWSEGIITRQAAQSSTSVKWSNDICHTVLLPVTPFPEFVVIIISKWLSLKHCLYKRLAYYVYKYKVDDVIKRIDTLGWIL